MREGDRGYQLKCKAFSGVEFMRIDKNYLYHENSATLEQRFRSAWADLVIDHSHMSVEHFFMKRI